MNLRSALVLGRVSNLPTVWTNVLAATVLCGLPLAGVKFGVAALAMSLFYLAGMYLNDYFDADWDAQHNRSRPIPSGLVTAKQVLSFAVIFAALAALVFVSVADYKISAALSLLILFLFICLYDWKHKHWPIAAPVLMGCCRLFVYLSVASSLVAWKLPLEVYGAALALLLYIAGITALARAEHENRVSSLLPVLLLVSPVGYSFYLGYEQTSSFILTMFLLAWIMRTVLKVLKGQTGAVGQAVAALLAGICLVDAAFIAASGHMALAWLAIVAFILCLIFQKFIPAT